MGGRVTTTTKGNWVERSSAVLSSLCAVECALKPVSILILPLLGVMILSSHLVELLMIGTVFVLGLGSHLHRLFKRRGDFRPLSIFSLGFITLMGAHVLLDESSMGGLLFAISGASLIAFSQFMGRTVVESPSKVQDLEELKNGQR